MQLYTYQRNAIDAIRSDPSTSQLISMPTGTGKTITFLSAIKELDKKCLVLVHRNELLEQTLEKAKLIGFKEDEISTITSEDKQDLNKLTISMVQTLVRNIDKYKENLIEMIVVDEAHHATSNSYLKIFEHFKISEKLLLGFTATPLRGDGKCLGNIFKSHPFKMTLSEATKLGYICPVHGIRYSIEKSLEEIDQVNGDYDMQQLDKVMNCDAINEMIASKCQYLGKVPAIVFCTSVNHAESIARLLRNKKRRAISISYRTSKKTLEKIFQWLKQGRIEFITNAVKLSEGFDFPPTQSIIIARPTRSPVLYKQMIGRGLRKSKDKHECFVLEFTGNDKDMLCWDDIDENCTFKTASIDQVKSIQEAEKHYRSKFKSPNVKILDVRVSPFAFYECRIRRMEKYRNFFRYVPFDAGFVLGHFIKKQTPARVPVYNCYEYFCFWKDIYKSFYIWDEGYMYFEEVGWEIKELERMVEHFCSVQNHGDFGRWYPSEEEPPTFKQKQLMNLKGISSARKAEMMIEDYFIKKAIDKFFFNGKPTKQLMEI